MAEGNKIGRLALLWVILILEEYEETLFARRDGVRPRNDDRFMYPCEEQNCQHDEQRDVRVQNKFVIPRVEG